jgi:hypothetical protein
MFFTFFVIWCVAGVLFQVLSLPLAAAIGLHRQMSLAGACGAAFAAYIVYWP